MNSGVKFRVGDRWITPQLHESVFRRGEGGGGLTPPSVIESTAMTASGDIITTLAVTGFNVPSSALAVPIILLASAAFNEFGSGGVTSVTWNARTFTLAGTVTSATSVTLQFWYLLNANLDTTDDIDIVYDEEVGSAVVWAYVIEGAANEGPELTDDNEVISGPGTISTTVVTATAAALVVDAMFNLAGTDPAATAVGQTEIAGAQVGGTVAVLSGSQADGPTPAGDRIMSWGNLGGSNNSIQLLAAWKPNDGTLTQPLTAKLVLGWDFSGIDSVVTVTGQGISSVTDSSGNGNTGTQGTDGSRPLYGVDSINGQLIADSANATRFIMVPADVAGWTSDFMPPFHILLVCNLQAFENNDYLLAILNASAAPRASLRMAVSGGNRIRAYAPAAGPSSINVLSTETALTTGVTYLIESTVDGSGTLSLTINEGTPASGGGASASGEALTLRRLFDSTAAVDAWIGAVYLFNDALTGPELAEWRAFLKQRWGYV